MNSGERAKTLNDSSAVRFWKLVFGMVALLSVVAVVTHLGEGRKLWELLRHMQPMPLVVASGLQVTTYLCAALLLHRALAYEKTPQRMRTLFPLAVAKQFVTQAAPSVGLSGNLMVIGGLQRRGVPRAVAVRAVLVNLLSYYLAFAFALVASIIVLWWTRDLTPVILSVLTLLLFVLTIASGAVFWFGDRAMQKLPPRIHRWLFQREVIDLLAEQSRSPWHPTLLVIATGLSLLIFLLDAATLYVLLLALGVYVDPTVVFASLVAATAVASIGLVPGGLGTFEGTCVALLHTHEVGIESALAATILLRGFTFWLPMLPGMLLARREVNYHP